MSSSHFAKMTSKARTTLPLAVRKALKAEPGDTLVYRVGQDGVRITRVEQLDWEHLKSLEKTLGEWDTAEDAAAFDDL